MRDRGFLEDELQREDLAACTALISATTDNFAALATSMGLNPTMDFRHADLSRCDFANSDIRGFNFTGADLRGALTFGTRWDASTIFEGADLGGTAFAFDRTLQKHFDDNPKLDHMVRSLASADWLGVEIWLGKDRDDADELEAAGRIAFRLYNQTDKPYIKSIILFHSKTQFAEQKDYRDFLLAELGRDNPPSVLTTCVTIVGRLFPEDDVVQSACRSLLAHDAEIVRSRALQAIMNGVQGTAIPRFVVDFIRQEPSGEIRRYYLGRVVRRMSSLHEQIARDGPYPGHYRDFRETISELAVVDLAKHYLREGDGNDVVLSAAEAQVPKLITKQRDIDAYLGRKRRQKLVKQLFDDFRMVGIAFNFR